MVQRARRRFATCCTARSSSARRGCCDGFWLIILQIGLIDIVFSIDSVFTAIGLANRVEVMVGAIVVSVAVMMLVSSTLSGFIERHPTIKGLALAFLVLVGASLIAESLDMRDPARLLVRFDGPVGRRRLAQHAFATAGLTCRVPIPVADAGCMK